MNRQTVVSLFLLISIFSFISCSDAPSPIGSDLLSGEDIEVLVLDSFIDSIAQRSSYDRKQIALGNSNRLFLGKKNNLEASILLKFFYVLPDSLASSVLADSITVIQAKVILNKDYVYSKDDEVLPIDFTVHKVNTFWNITSFTEDSLLTLSFDAEDISTDRSFSDTLYTFNLNNNTALTWMREAVDTNLTLSNGIYIQPSANSGKIVGLKAFSQSQDGYATIETIYQRTDGLRDTIYAALVGDLSVVKGVRQDFGQENLAVQSGFSLLSELAFDVSSLPKHAVINNAELELTKDTLLSVLGNTFTNRLIAFFVKDSVTNELDSTVSVTLEPTDSSFKGLITSYVNRWQSGEPNHGLTIIPAGLVEGLELFMLKGSNAADYSKRPRLKITYNTIKQ